MRPHDLDLDDEEVAEAMRLERLAEERAYDRRNAAMTAQAADDAADRMAGW